MRWALQNLTTDSAVDHKLAVAPLRDMLTISIALLLHPPVQMLILSHNCTDLIRYVAGQEKSVRISKLWEKHEYGTAFNPFRIRFLQGAQCQMNPAARLLSAKSTSVTL